jgi:hypothetical protein
MPIQKKMYVLVRNDLSETYRLVQGAHAVAQFGIIQRIEFEKWNNSTIVFLGIRNLRDMRMWETKVYDEVLPHACFKEPDLDGQITAIACYDTGEIFRSLKTA